MGEKIKTIASLNDSMEIELNKATQKGGPRYIHIQNPSFRFCVTEKEFLEIAIALKKSLNIFKQNKKLEG